VIEQVASPSEGTLLGYLSIPRLNAKTPLVEGTTEASLRLGPGHLQGTSLPGEPGNSVVAAHRDTHFRVLKDVEVGDKLVIERKSTKVFYAVTSVRIVDPTDVSVLKNTGGSMMTLITCYPFHFIGPAPKRLVVQAIRSEAGDS
jgi:sortase A